MWYFITALIFQALELAAIAVFWRVCDIKDGTVTKPNEILEVIPAILGLSFMGALVWPLITLIIIFAVLFNLYLKDIFNKIVNWVNERL